MLSRSVHYSTNDLYLVAYLLYCGCKIEGITKISPSFSNFVLTHRKIHAYVDAYNQYKPIKVSVRHLNELRQNLKIRIKYLPIA